MTDVVDKAPIEPLLRELKAAEGPLSGARMGRVLGVSRTALWKQVQQLRRLGYRIDAAPRVGYRLAGVPDRPYPWEVRDGLRTRRLGQRVHHFAVTGSTQDEARRLAEEGAPEGTLVVAEEQRSPRGRLGRSYFTPPGGLWFSLLLRPRRSPEQVTSLSLLAAVGLHQAIEAVTDLRPSVRWPNDLLIEGRKLVGILVELASEQDVLRYVILGIGVNVNLTNDDFPPDLQPIATSLRQVLGREVARVPLLQRILERTEALYDRYLESGPRPILDAWRALPTVLGQRVTVEELRERWEGTAVDLDDAGALLVRRDDGALQRVLAGDVRIAAGTQT
jgi:BirA family biotin operon repressor/biotin-[acetyl-CoA-carboxylase] ligase